eukprot:GHVP01021897.1.p2 GENE.GHVP01021897.1~~GHVP01021897.1.p2  ORF type:complete len:584 (+),score=141.40 GHVP01021897.1:1630-3381(+)
MKQSDARTTQSEDVLVRTPIKSRQNNELLSTPNTPRTKEKFSNMTIEQLNKTFEDWMKITAENKINTKNSWSLALIDYFTELRFLKDKQNEINFQKASYTLQGCIKVYTSRVDSIVVEAEKLLTGLGENQLDKKDNRKKTILNKSKQIELNSDLLLLKDSLIIRNDYEFKKLCTDLENNSSNGSYIETLSRTKKGSLIFDTIIESIVDSTFPNIDGNSIVANTDNSKSSKHGGNTDNNELNPSSSHTNESSKHGVSTNTNELNPSSSHTKIVKKILRDEIGSDIRSKTIPRISLIGGKVEDMREAVFDDLETRLETKIETATINELDNIFIDDNPFDCGIEEDDDLDRKNEETIYEGLNTASKRKPMSFSQLNLHRVAKRQKQPSSVKKKQERNKIRIKYHQETIDFEDLFEEKDTIKSIKSKNPNTKEEKVKIPSLSTLFIDDKLNIGSTEVPVVFNREENKSKNQNELDSIEEDNFLFDDTNEIPMDLESEIIIENKRPVAIIEKRPFVDSKKLKEIIEINISDEKGNNDYLFSDVVRKTKDCLPEATTSQIFVCLLHSACENNLTLLGDSFYNSDIKISK